VRCCWWLAAAIGALVFITSLIFGSYKVDCDTMDPNIQKDCQRYGLHSLWASYAFLICASPFFVGIALYGIYGIIQAEKASQESGSPLYVQNLSLTCRAGGILGSVIFLYSLAYLIYYALGVLLLPWIFLPCFCGVSMGPVMWANCCLFQRNLKYQQDSIRFSALSDGQVSLQPTRPQFFGFFHPGDYLV